MGTRTAINLIVAFVASEEKNAANAGSLVSTCVLHLGAVPGTVHLETEQPVEVQGPFGFGPDPKRSQK